MKVAILGIGAYGIALANVLYENANEVTMWSKLEKEVEEIKLIRENEKVLPGIKIPGNIEISDDLEWTLKDKDVIILAIPTKFVREIARDVAKYLTKSQIICLVSKGIEEKTNKFMSEVVYEETSSNNICMLSGPSFAIELAKNIETGLVIASKNIEICNLVKDVVQNSNVRVEVSKDIIGVQVSATVKNIFAILMGILEGQNKSDSTKSAVLTCLIADLKEITKVLGGNEETVYTYAGIGDLLLTCMSSKSRNYTFGYNIGRGLTIEETFDKMKVDTIEGLYNLKSVNDILKEKNVKIKSINLINELIYEGKNEEYILEHINS